MEGTLDPSHSTRPDTHEGLYFGRHVAASSPEAALPLHGPNQWLPEVGRGQGGGVQGLDLPRHGLIAIVDAAPCWA